MFGEGYRMNIEGFKTKALSVKAEAQLLVGIVSNQNHLGLLNGLIDSMNIIVTFLEDDLNISVLSNYSVKEGENQEICPLDILCRSVLQKFEDIDALLKSEIFNFLRPREQDGVVAIPRNIYNSQELSMLTTKLKDTGFLNLLFAYEVLKHLDGHNKTLVILGPNGSGKTSFANYLKNLETHIKVIPASKPIRAMGHIPSMYNSKLEDFNSELYGGQILREDLLQKLIIALCTEHDDIARKYLDTGVKEKKSIYEMVKEIFDAFFEVKLDNSGFSVKAMKAQKDGQDPFDFNNMSDGERVAFFYISTVIAAPSHSFIIVDEPENHLNPAIYNKIWDKLIAVRNDCQFIFISHTIDFISARSNFELVKIKSFVRPNKFEFEFLGGALEDIQTEYIVEIVGSRKPILFCEGSKSDYDYKIYENLFGEKYTVIATGNCVAVENSVEACNMHATTYSIQSAIGIIDSDLKSSEEIERLKEKRIYPLKCNEIEMLLLDEAIFKRVLAQVYKPESEFEAFKNAFFHKLNERKQHIVKRLVKTQIDEKLRSSIIDDRNNRTKEEIKENLSSIFDSLDVDTIWSNCETKITNIITQKNYEEALQYCCLEHTEIIVGVATRFVSNYAAIALGVLGSDEQLSSVIKSKYFPDLNV